MRISFVNPLGAFGLATVLAASAMTMATASEKALYSFKGGSDGAQPSGGLIADRQGNLYGATEEGGTGTGCYGGVGCGTLFEIAHNDGETMLYSFPGGNKGAGPSSPLLMDSAGNLYGIAGGGAGTNCTGGCGVVFKLAPDKTETILYTFQGGSDGQYPQGSLIADANGNLYGLTLTGGNYNGSECAQAGCGTVFEVQPNGSKITLYAFQGGADGAYPQGGPIADASGNLYGTTYGGGGSACEGGGCGTVFKLTPGGKESVLYSFKGGTDGETPRADVVADSAGNLYGTTYLGGSGSAGTVFKVTPAGTETVLYSFKGGKDGANPEAGLVMDGSGNLYGTTWYGGSHGCKQNKVGNGCGTVFELTPAGEESVLRKFSDFHQARDRGVFPAAALLLGKKGLVYGTTTAGGADNVGVVFSVNK
jgi:uncharacterized repeat protein (TIGR03803 family)